MRWISIGVIACLWAGGWGLTQFEWTKPSGASKTAALVQGAIPQDAKWQEGARDRTLKLYVDLTVQGFGSDFVVLPEAALPVLAEELMPTLQVLEGAAQARGSTIIVGLLRHDADGDRYYNSLFALGTPGATYDKRRLVPFGEFFPVPASVREWMRLMTLPYIDMTPGAIDQPLLDARGTKLAASICYEDAWGSLGIAGIADAELLVNV